MARLESGNTAARHHHRAIVKRLEERDLLRDISYPLAFVISSFRRTSCFPRSMTFS